jgi:hypothetical protein
MFEQLKTTLRQLRDIRQILRDQNSGASRERMEHEFEEARAKREAESRAYRRKLERALRRKPNMTLAELHGRFPVNGEAAPRKSTYRRARPVYTR